MVFFVFRDQWFEVISRKICSGLFVCSVVSGLGYFPHNMSCSFCFQWSVAWGIFSTICRGLFVFSGQWFGVISSTICRGLFVFSGQWFGVISSTICRGLFMCSVASGLR
jgi:hypothetical protein